MYDKAKIMSRAWDLMRTKYRMGNPFTFNEIGRKCFSWCMAEAWREARIAAIPADEKAARIAKLREEMNNTDFLPFGMSASRHRAMIQEQISQLAA